MHGKPLGPPGLPGRGSGEPKSERRLSALLDGELGRLSFTTGDITITMVYGIYNTYGITMVGIYLVNTMVYL